MDRLQRASPFAGGPGGKASGWARRAEPSRLSIPSPLTSARTPERVRRHERTVRVDTHAAQRAPHAGHATFLERRAGRLVRAVQDTLRRVRQSRRLASAALIVMHEHALVVIDVAV